MIIKIFGFVFVLVFAGYVMLPQSPCERIDHFSMVVDWPGDIVRQGFTNFGADPVSRIESMKTQYDVRNSVSGFVGRLFYGDGFAATCPRVVGKSAPLKGAK